MTLPLSQTPDAVAQIARLTPRPTRSSIAGRRSFVALGWAVAVYLAAAFLFSAIEGWKAHGALVFAIAAAVVAALALIARVRIHGAIAVVLATSFSAQIVWGAAANTHPFGEHGVLWTEASRLAQNFDYASIFQSASPGAIVVWGAVIAALGDDVAVLRVVAAMFWTAQTALVWRIATLIPEVRPHALGAAALFGLAPAAIAFGGVISAEAVFGLFALAAIYALLSHRRRGLRRSALLGGAMSGCAYVVAPVGLAHLLGLLAVLVIGIARARSRLPQRRLALAFGLALAGFIGVAAPFALLGTEREGLAAALPVDSIGYQLLVGTNRASIDGYSVSDLESAGFLGAEDAATEDGAKLDSNAAAAQIALERVAADPIGFIVFATTEKLRRLWRSEREALSWSLESPGGAHAAWVEGAGADWARRAADGALIALLAAAAVAAVRLALRSEDVSDPTRWVLIFSAVIALALFHLLLDAQERRHMAFAPLLAVMAPFAVARLQTRARLQRFAERGKEALASVRAKAKTPAPEAKQGSPASLTTPSEVLAAELAPPKPPRRSARAADAAATDGRGTKIRIARARS